MKVPRDLSGIRLVACLCRQWGYRQTNQVGSHMVLETETPTHQRIAVPAHKSVNVGTLSSILRAVATHKGVSRDDILKSLD
jgi:predicted RNA binding protein YcfA (HicA-like mRNA interferase family)